jgi:hypothetical protein
MSTKAKFIAALVIAYLIAGGVLVWWLTFSPISAYLVGVVLSFLLFLISILLMKR